MNYTQIEKIMSITERTLVVGMDIAKNVQYARAFDYRGIELGKARSFENTAEVFRIFEDWMKLLANQK